jgi:hypothetical protein
MGNFIRTIFVASVGISISPESLAAEVGEEVAGGITFFGQGSGAGTGATNLKLLKESEKLDVGELLRILLRRSELHRSKLGSAQCGGSFGSADIE